MVSFDEKLGVLTPNYTTPYVVGVADLSKSGPFVVELPKGLLAGMIIDVRLQGRCLWHRDWGLAP